MPSAQDLIRQIDNLPSRDQERLVHELVARMGYWPLLMLEGYLPDRYPSLVSTPDVCGGSTRIVRTRIPVWTLEHMRQLGFTESKILQSFPTLCASDLVQAWGYVASHRAEINAEIQANETDPLGAE